MKKLSLFLMLLASTPFMYQCSDAQFEQVEEPRIQPIFSAEVQEMGELFSQTLKSTAIELKKQKISPSDQSGILKISQNVTRNIFVEREYFSKSSNEYNLITSSKEFQLPTLKESLNSGAITKSQKRVIKLIEEKINSSTSFIQLSNELAKINNNIYSTIPFEEQEFLFKVTSNLYFGLETINQLIIDGHLPGKAHNPKGINLATLMLQPAYAQVEWDEGQSGIDWASCTQAATGYLGLAVGIAFLPTGGFALLATAAVTFADAFWTGYSTSACIDSFS